MIEPKYKIGEPLYFKNEVAHWKVQGKKYPSEMPKPMTPIAINQETCSGGTQINYIIRLFISTGTVLNQFNEVELTNSLD